MENTYPDETNKEIYERLTGKSLLLKENVPMYVRVSEETIEKIPKSIEYFTRNAYNPLDEAPNLYTEIAKIKFFDIPSLKRFIENFGLPYGRDLFATNIYFVMNYEMDLFRFYELLHRYKKTLDIFEAISSHNQEKIEKYAEEFKEYAKNETKEYLYSLLNAAIGLKVDDFLREIKEQKIERAEIVKRLDMFFENKIEGITVNPIMFEKWHNISNESPRTIAKHYLVELLNNSNKGSSTFAIINNDEIHPATTFDNLFEVAYYQLSRAVIRNVEMRHCDNCGALFEVTHDSRRFCPPLPGHKISTCQNTYNQRMKRKRKKAKELAAKGYTETQIAEKLKMRAEEIREWLHSR
jgi:hypothetical protein